MPLIKLETVHPDCKWALWEITEPFEQLQSELDLTRESEDLASIKNDLKKREKTAGRLLLKKILDSWNESYLGTGCDIYGKPYLLDKEYHISISHSHGYSVAIVDKNWQIGIDIELIKEKIVKISKRVFSDAELGTPATLPKLTTLWCVKESLYKVYGLRRLDFRKNILIEPFTFDEQGGSCKGEVKTTEASATFNIKYLKYKDFIITYILNS